MAPRRGLVVHREITRVRKTQVCNLNRDAQRCVRALRSVLTPLLIERAAAELSRAAAVEAGTGHAHHGMDLRFGLILAALGVSPEGIRRQGSEVVVV